MWRGLAQAAFRPLRFNSARDGAPLTALRRHCSVLDYFQDYVFPQSHGAPHFDKFDLSRPDPETDRGRLQAETMGCFRYC
jgi:hypothetical protein